MDTETFWLLTSTMRRFGDYLLTLGNVRVDLDGTIRVPVSGGPERAVLTIGEGHDFPGIGRLTVLDTIVRPTPPGQTGGGSRVQFLLERPDGDSPTPG